MRNRESLRLVLLLVFLASVVLGLVALSHSGLWLAAVVLGYLVVRIGITMSYPMAVDELSGVSLPETLRRK